MKKKKIFGNTKKEQLKAGARDVMQQFVLEQGTIRGALIYSTKLVNEMRANHELGILETMILGYGYIGALLLSSNLKGSERLVLEITCDGPLRGMSVEANTYGEVRGYLRVKQIPVENPLTDANIAPFVGDGLLSVTRYLEKAKYPFTSQVKLKHRSLALNLAYFSIKSEQTPSSYSLSVHFNKKGEVTGAGGLLIQALPGAESDLLSSLEEVVNNLPSIGKEYAESLSTETFILSYFARYSPRFFQKKRIAFMCHCSKARFKIFLAALPEHEFKSILAKGPFPLILTCFNCNTSYSFSQSELQSVDEIRNNKRK
jgi:molecular chaperone Hsp33